MTPPADPQPLFGFATVWREGDRIRDTSGVGFHDRVTDQQIREHIRTTKQGAVFVAFAEVVLAIRAYERVVSRG